MHNTLLRGPVEPKQFIAAVPEGRWTTYGDVAEAAGNRRGAMAIGVWLLHSGGNVPFFWRVLTAQGYVPDTVRGGGVGLPHDAVAARDVLRGEGVEIDPRGRAPQHQRLRPEDWNESRTAPVVSTCGIGPTAPKQDVIICLAAHGYQQLGVYEPASRFWAFQGIESAIAKSER
jgi:alkylated DNA nucleotide flippase Atl1